jgi:protein-disulfide isomerase
MSTSSRVPLAIVFGGIVVAGALYFSLPPRETPDNFSRARQVSAADHILGSPAARVIVVTYTDFDCAYCKAFHTAMNQFIAQEGTKGEVAWALRHFPLSEIHPNAFAHARAAECAAETGGNDTFWDFADALFAAQPALPKDYGIIAKSAGIAGTAFASCVANQKPVLDARVMADRENALSVGADGTPYSIIFVDGAPADVMKGGYSYAAIEARLEAFK